MVRTAVEDLIRLQAFAARKMHPAFRATHHVFGTLHRLVRAMLDLALVALEYPKSQSKPDDEKEDLGQAAVRYLMLALVCRKARRASSGFHPGCNLCESREMRIKDDGRGERIRTSDSCVPNAVLYQAELHPDAATARPLITSNGKSGALLKRSRHREIGQL
jgi:hypothetical protein